MLIVDNDQDVGAPAARLRGGGGLSYNGKALCPSERVSPSRGLRSSVPFAILITLGRAVVLVIFDRWCLSCGYSYCQHCRRQYIVERNDGAEKA